MITFAQFKEINLCVASIASAERMEGSEKLLKLMVHIGDDETRQIVAGIGRRYDPEALVGRQIVIVANLEPRTLMGLESHGMLLAADTDDGPVLLCPSEEVPVGSRIK